MGEVRVRMLRELAVFHGDEAVKLPPSRRTRALLAYLALTARPHRRDWLCELIWDIPDDPRGALRWSLSKLRPIINAADVERLAADRERVLLEGDQLRIDLKEMAAKLAASDLSITQLENLREELSQPLLGGVDLPEKRRFQAWLTAQREEAQRLKGLAVRQLAQHDDLAPGRALPLAREWLELEPFSPDAASLLVTRLSQYASEAEAQTAANELEARFQKAGIPWARESSPQPAAPAPPVDPSVHELQARQKIRFCSAADGVRIAYATVGQGSPIVKAANWLTHLELDWEAPIWSPLFRELANTHQFVRYDERGNGLSDWDVDEISFSTFVTDLETVVDTVGLERFALLGISQGAAVSIEYAVRHPERVSRLILFGGYPAGWRVDAPAELIREREAVMTLTATGWGQDNPAYRQIFSSTFMPTATADELEWFNEFQRHTTSPENAVRFLSAFGDIDVRDQLAKVSVPTLVIHSAGDLRIPAETGRDLAATIPNAEYLSLNSQNHLLLGREPASRLFIEAVNRFLEPKRPS